MVGVVSTLASLVLVAAPLCPDGHSQAECDSVWAQTQAFVIHRDAGLVRAAATAARNQVTKDLADPEAARFRNVHAFLLKRGADVLFCGEINAKNRFGAYTGYRAFVAGPDLGVIAGEANNDAIADAQAEMVRSACTATPIQNYGPVRF